MIISDAQKEKLVNSISKLMEEYDHKYTREGITTFLNEWERNKGELINLFRKHPKWDENNLAIIFSHDFERGIDVNQITLFCRWLKEQLKEWARTNEIKHEGKTLSDWQEYRDIIRNLAHSLRRLEDEEIPFNVKIEGKEFSDFATIKAYVRELDAIVDKLSITSYCLYIGYESFPLEEEKFKFGANATAAIDIIENITSSNLEKREADELNNLFPNLRATEGQKTSRMVSKLGKILGFDTIKDIRPNGRDYGWNREFAIYADSINPLKINRHTVVSINPLDYFTMSFGHNWASCHTIDATNKRHASNSYHGMYMSGDMSYALDSVSLIFYTVDAKFKGEEFWKEDKMQRCVFCIGKEKFCQSRVYPDGRDGGDKGLATQFRNIVQMIISELWEVPNLWKTEKGAEVCSNYTYSYGTHYRDYIEYDDGVMCFLKGSENTTPIEIGHDPICLECGREYDEAGQLNCNDCRNKVLCDHCGDEVDNDDVIWINGYAFCCEECAMESGYVYTVDSGWMSVEYCRQEVISGDYYYYWENHGCVTEDGKYFRYVDDAFLYGYRYIEEDDIWVTEDKTGYCEQCGNYYLLENANDNTCPNCGCVLNEEVEREVV